MPTLSLKCGEHPTSSSRPHRAKSLRSQKRVRRFVHFAAPLFFSESVFGWRVEVLILRVSAQSMLLGALFEACVTQPAMRCDKDTPSHMLKQRAPEAIRAPLLGGSLYMRHSLQSIASKDHAENQAPDNHVLDVRVGELDTTNKQFTEEVGSKRATTNGMPSVSKRSAPPILRSIVRILCTLSEACYNR